MSSRHAELVPAHPAWSDALDDYERVLDQHAAALADADIDPSTVRGFEPQAGLGPLPRALRPRALSLAERTSVLVGVAERLVDESPAPRPTARARPRRDPRPATFDQRA